MDNTKESDYMEIFTELIKFIIQKLKFQKNQILNKTQ